VYHGWEGERGPQGNREDTHGNLYRLGRTAAGRWADRSDEIKIKRPGPRSSGVRIWGDNLCDWKAPPRVAVCQESSPTAKFSFHNQSEHGLSSSGHTMDKVMKMAYRSHRQVKKRRVFSFGVRAPPSSQLHACKTSISQERFRCRWIAKGRRRPGQYCTE